MKTVFRDPLAWNKGFGPYFYVCEDHQCAAHLRFSLWYGSTLVKHFITLDEAVAHIKAEHDAAEAAA